MNQHGCFSEGYITFVDAVTKMNRNRITPEESGQQTGLPPVCYFCSSLIENN